MQAIDKIKVQFDDNSNFEKSNVSVLAVTNFESKIPEPLAIENLIADWRKVQIGNICNDES